MTNEEAKTILDRFNAWRKGWGDDFPYEAKQISAAIDVAISALSAPLPHQDGASAEDVNTDKLEFKLKALVTVCKRAESKEAESNYIMECVDDFIKAMHQFAKS